MFRQKLPIISIILLITFHFNSCGGGDSQGYTISNENPITDGNVVYKYGVPVEFAEKKSSLGIPIKLTVKMTANGYSSVRASVGPYILRNQQTLVGPGTYSTIHLGLESGFNNSEDHPYSVEMDAGDGDDVFDFSSFFDVFNGRQSSDSKRDYITSHIITTENLISSRVGDDLLNAGALLQTIRLNDLSDINVNLANDYSSVRNRINSVNIDTLSSKTDITWTIDDIVSGDRENVLNTGSHRVARSPRPPEEENVSNLLTYVEVLHCLLDDYTSGNHLGVTFSQSKEVLEESLTYLEGLERALNEYLEAKSGEYKSKFANLLQRLNSALESLGEEITITTDGSDEAEERANLIKKHINYLRKMRAHFFVLRDIEEGIITEAAAAQGACGGSSSAE